MKNLCAHLAPLDKSSTDMLEKTTQWASLNSGTQNLAGIANVADAVLPNFERLGFTYSQIASAPVHAVSDNREITPIKRGPVHHLKNRPNAKRRILLAGHLDTVFPKGHSFQSVEQKSGKLHGPGCADMKGGIAIMHQALSCFEQSPFASEIGFDIVFNSDEETGSHGSSSYMETLATRCDVGLIYEPALPDGTLAGARGGSGIFTFIVRGKAANAGRSFNDGRSAIIGAANVMIKINALNGLRENCTFNVGTVQGGVDSNVVPDLCLMVLNVRGRTPSDMQWIDVTIRAMVESENFGADIKVELSGGIHRPCKPNKGGTLALFEAVKACGSEIGIDIAWQPTGGCSDGNNLVAAGLPTVDTLGVCGAFIHSADEYAIIDSFEPRARLSAMLMMGLASGAIEWPYRLETAKSHI